MDNIDARPAGVWLATTRFICFHFLSRRDNLTALDRMVEPSVLFLFLRVRLLRAL